MNAKRFTIVCYSCLVVVSMRVCSGFRSPFSPSSTNPARIAADERPTQTLFRSNAAASTRIHADAVASAEEGKSPTVYTQIDYSALLFKYPVGLIGQASLIYAFLAGIDKAVNVFSLRIPFAVNFLFMYAFNLKSSAFSLLPNRPNDEEDNFNKANKPSWTPPGIAFVFGWPLLTFGLRAYTASMVIETMGGKYATIPIMSLMVHLGFSSLWNTINMVEKRLGVSVLALYGMWITKAVTAWQFYRVNPLAGKLLALTLTWITAAAALETSTWQINPDSDTGKKEPLLPMRSPKWMTKFRWEK